MIPVPQTRLLPRFFTLGLCPLLLLLGCADEASAPHDPAGAAPPAGVNSTGDGNGDGNPGAPASMTANDGQPAALPMQPGEMPIMGAGDAPMAGGPADPVMDGAPEVPAIPERILSQNLLVPQVAPGAEATVCITKRLSNAVAERVVEVRAHISLGSHHFIVDRSPTDVQIPVLTPCPGLAGTDQSRILVAEKPDTVFSMPPGVVFSVRPEQNLTMELHYINYTEAPLDIEGTIELVLAPEGSEDQYQEAGMIFTGNPAIALLPGQQSMIEFFGVPAATPEAPVHIFAMTSHTHSLGTRSWIERVPNGLEPNGELLHESLDWAEPPMDQFDPPLTFTGADGVRLRCEYNNTTDQIVTFGTRFNDEMCFMWLYYYPNTGALF